MIIFAAQIRAARGLIKISQSELALACGLSLQTIRNFENSDEAIKKASFNTIEKIKEAIESKGVNFLDSNTSEGVGVRLRKN